MTRTVCHCVVRPEMVTQWRRLLTLRLFQHWVSLALTQCPNDPLGPSGRRWSLLGISCGRLYTFGRTGECVSLLVGQAPGTLWQEKSATAEARDNKRKAALCFGDCLNVTRVVLEELRREETGRQLAL